MKHLQPSPWRRAVVACLVCLLSQNPALAQRHPLERLSWMAGCWASETGEPGSGEMWTPLAGGTILGVGRTIRGGRTVAHEFMQIRESAEGEVVFIALPSGQQEATFTLAELGRNEVAFENPRHDFPQRVSYRLLPDDRLAARIEGVRDGIARSVDFPLQRTRCGEAWVPSASPPPRERVGHSRPLPREPHPVRPASSWRGFRIVAPRRRTGGIGRGTPGA